MTDPDKEKLLNRYTENSSREWIVTNGIGGYASSTLSGVNTRRYHGVLVASFNPPTERKVLVSKIDETVYDGVYDIGLGTNLYSGGHIHPHGYKYLKSFERKPFPTMYFESKSFALSKTVFMVYGSNTTVVEYTNTSQKPFLLKLAPYYVHRDYHSLQHERTNFQFEVKERKGRFHIHAYYGAEQVIVKSSAGKFCENRFWNKNLEYSIERSRGQAYTEDTYCLGHFEIQLHPGEKTWLMFSTETAVMDSDPAQLKASELERLESIVSPAIKDPFLHDLIVSGDQFIVQRQTTDSYSMIAGYHWFTDWGRDSMIAIRGLCIATGKQEMARSIILTFLSYLKQGIIPNRFPDYKGDIAEYNTADATLWLFIAVYEYDQKFDDISFLNKIFPKLVEIIHYHMQGTLHNIHVTEKGFISQGSKDIQLTWMDARINDVVFTPREGCPVEINALWYNALRIYEHIAEKTETETDPAIIVVRKKFEDNFLNAFWNRDGHLNDIVMTDRTADPSVRPNQIYAISLPFSLLAEKEEKFVLESVRKNLLTSYGLRTLDPKHPDFKPRYEGDVWSRDAAYHQGTVWPFLMPEYFTAYLKAYDYSNEAKKTVSAFLNDIRYHFYNRECIHGISEIFDGLEPAEGKGCIHQAWSVSNLILLMMKTGITVE